MKMNGSENSYRIPAFLVLLFTCMIYLSLMYLCLIDLSTGFIHHLQHLLELMPILVRFTSILQERSHKVLFEQHRHGVNVLDQHQPQPLAVHVIVPVVTKAACHLSGVTIFNIQTGTRYIHLHKVPNIWKKMSSVTISMLTQFLTNENAVKLERVKDVDDLRHESQLRWDILTDGHEIQHPHGGLQLGGVL